MTEKKVVYGDVVVTGTPLQELEDLIFHIGYLHEEIDFFNRDRSYEEFLAEMTDEDLMYYETDEARRELYQEKCAEWADNRERFSEELDNTYRELKDTLKGYDLKEVSHYLAERKSVCAAKVEEHNKEGERLFAIDWTHQGYATTKAQMAVKFLDPKSASAK